MPCGGIYPVSDGPAHGKCWVCYSDDPEPMLFCEEWDTFLHAKCVLKFLNSKEGKIVLLHKHPVYIEFDVIRQ